MEREDESDVDLRCVGFDEIMCFDCSLVLRCMKNL
jgi:hypothetical protein